nr:sigma-70 family RNA polymerase sigma factor [uncultured Eisenbergiella sp.]
MKKINLRDYYPFYTYDAIVEVPDEVAALLLEYKRREEAQRIHTYRHKAFFSLDFGDNIECRALIVAPSPFEIIERRQMAELIYKALSSLPDKQAQRIYAHYFLGMSKAAIARAEGVNESNIRKSISRGLESLQSFLKKYL